MTPLASQLYVYLHSNGVAVDGVSVGKLDDRSTWSVQPAELQGAAQPLLDAFQPPSGDELAIAEARLAVEARALRAIVIELHAAIPAHAGKPTLAQLRDLIIARYRSLAQ